MESRALFRLYDISLSVNESRCVGIVASFQPGSLEEYRRRHVYITLTRLVVLNVYESVQ